MPHLGHSPGPDALTSGCMGQVYAAPAPGVVADAGFRSKAMPHFGQAPGWSEVTPAHIGQKYFAAEGGFG